MNHASTMETPPGVLIALKIPASEIPKDISLLLILDGIRNPGNLGTILRTACAAGVEGVLLAPGCVDPFNPKAIRGGMGAQLRLPIHRARWSEISNLSRNLRVWLACPLGTIAHTEVNWKHTSALIIGSEAKGHGDSARALCSDQLFIPMTPGVESLNVAVAAGIILFEAARQRSIS
jgi:TrmH family RNA methyltransferase